MDTTDPEISFNSEGVCNHCLNYEKYKDTQLLSGEEAKKATEKMVEEIEKNGKGKSYNCIMGVSGGVDSSYLAYYAVKELGLKPLVVHVDSGWNSELAVNNIENIVNILNLDLHTLVLDWDEIRDLQRAFFKASVPNADIPQDHAFFAGLYKEASKYKIKSVLNGGNMQTESILPKAWGYSNTDWRHIKNIHQLFGSHPLKRFPKLNYTQKTFIYPYMHQITVYRPLELIDYKKEDVKKFLSQALSWRDYGGKHFESFFTKFFQSYYLPTKFGFDKRKAHLSSLIVSGQMTRQEALAELQKPLYPDSDEFEADLQYFIKKLGFSKEEWKEIMNKPPIQHNDYKTSQKTDRILKDYIFKPLSKFRSLVKS